MTYFKRGSTGFWFSIPTLMLSLLLSACNSDGSSETNISDESGLLRKVSSGEELLTAVTTGLESETSPALLINRQGDMTAAFQLSSPATAEASQNFTTTYTLEADVAEYDVVKYSGEHLFIARSLHNNCCFAIPLTETVAVDAAESIAPLPQNNAVVRVLATDPGAATASEVNTIDVGGNEFIQGMYLFDDQLALLTTENYYGIYGRTWLDIRAWSEQHAGLSVYDVSDVANPTLRWKVEVEGGFVESRRIGETIYFVTRHTPRFPGYIHYPVNPQQVADNTAVLSNLSLADVIPTVSVNGQHFDLFAPSDCFVTNSEVDEVDAPGYPVITTVIAVPVNDPQAMKTLCYNESAVGVYLSDSALYLTDVRYGEITKTRIHKFAINETQMSYRGSAYIEGFVWTGGQRDFRLNEFNDQLRVLTTQWTGDTTDNQDHQLFILEESPTELALQVVATLPNSSRPDEIGKDNESLYGVRFYGDKAYLVTFEQIDPLYVLDLTDASDPYIAGSLDIPGFSDFLHPVNDQLLLGVGALPDSGNRVKLELFDVANTNTPTSLASVLIGSEAEYSWSEANFNRHAFTYQSDVNGIDRFAIPASVSGYDSQNNYYQEDALYLFEIHNKQTPNAATLIEAGKIAATPKPNETYWWSGNNRSVFHSEAVYFVSGEYVWSAFWGAEEQNGPF